MVKESIFREYDIRGIVEPELNSKLVKRIGYYLGKTFQERNKNRLYIAIGYDTRVHSKELFLNLISGLNQAQITVLDMGMVTTGLNYFSNYQEFEIEGKKIKPNGSVMITGSHNPKEYNGFKITFNKKPFFADDIYKLRDTILSSKEFLIEDNHNSFKIDVKKPFIDYMVKEFSHLKGFDIPFVVDCGNGVADTVLTQIFDKLQFKYKALFTEPNGDFPNHHPDPSIEENLKDLKLSLKDEFSYGFAYDGDADRVVFLTKKQTIPTDLLAILFAKRLENPIVVGEVKCSQVMYDEINKMGKAIMHKAGHSNLKIKIKELNADFGVEVSGHIFFNDRFFGFDDGVYASFRILELLKEGVNIDKELEALPKMFSSPEKKVKTTDEQKFILISHLKELLKKPPKDFPKILKILEIDGLRVIFEKGWALVRASNTTPILVTRFEANSMELALEYEKKIENLIEVAKDEINYTTN